MSSNSNAGLGSSERKPRRGDVFELSLDSFGPRGEPRGRAQGYRFEVDRGVPGDRVLVEVGGRRREQVRARVLELLSPSPQRRAPLCEHTRACGGCRFQAFDYAAQLVHKSRAAERALAAAGIEIALEPMLAAPSSFRYRTKMDFTFSNRRWLADDEPDDASSDFALGLHPRDFHSKVIDVRRCEIQFAEGDRILASVRDLARAHELAPWNGIERTGLLRHLVLRKSRASGEILANFVTADESRERFEPFVRELVRERPEITTLVQNLHSKPAQAALSEREIVHHGLGYVRESLGGASFRLSANSFFQTNVAAAERLLEIVLEESAVRADDVLFDLYCGAGAFSLPLARRVQRALGFELVESAVRDAWVNAAENRIANVEFVAGDLALTLAADSARPVPSLAVVDPPRAGMHPDVVGALCALAPKRVVYVSCHLPSAARDVVSMLARGYELRRVRTLDLFPHTPHFETVLSLARAR